MKEKIITLKKRIEINYTQLQRKNILIKPLLNNLNELIQNNESSKVIEKFFAKHDHIIFNVEYFLQKIEKKGKEINSFPF